MSYERGTSVLPGCSKNLFWSAVWPLCSLEYTRETFIITGVTHLQENAPPPRTLP